MPRFYARAASFDHPVGAQEEGLRDRQAERLCRLQFDDELELAESKPTGFLPGLHLREIIAGAL
jgi:hypothetical protein